MRKTLILSLAVLFVAFALSAFAESSTGTLCWNMKGGKYLHNTPNCSFIDPDFREFVQPISPRAQALDAFASLQPCPVCAGILVNTFWYNLEDRVYFHETTECTSVPVDIRNTLRAIPAAQLTWVVYAALAPCPTCVGEVET